MLGSDRLKIKAFDPDGAESREDVVAVESALAIRVNGHRLITLMCTPLDLEHLVRGYLLSAGIIETLAEVSAISINEVDGVADVQVPDYHVDRATEGAVSSGCGRGEVYLEVIRQCRRNDTKFLLDAAELRNQMTVFNRSSALFLETGGVHSAALSTGREIVFLHEDIGRHNAVDKVIGHAACSGVSLSDKVLLTSGRLSSEILIKAAKRGVPAVVSRSAPTTLAVELAIRLNITLIGFARGNRMNIYAGESRIDA